MEDIAAPGRAATSRSERNEFLKTEATRTRNSRGPNGKSGARGRDETTIANALARQLDLMLSRVDAAGVVYQNDAWMPLHAVVPPGDKLVQVDGRDPLSAALRSEPDGVTGAASGKANWRCLPLRSSRATTAGPAWSCWLPAVPASAVYSAGAAQ